MNERRGRDAVRVRSSNLKAQISDLKSPIRPTREELKAAYGRALPDLIAPGLDVLFVGINPSLYSAAIGHHFGRPGNRFWPALHLGGFTPRLLSPIEDQEVLALRLGLTNVVGRATARADELDDEDMRAGAVRLEKKVRRYQPKWAAFLGVTCYRTGFGRPKAKLGPQSERIGETRLWVLPSPSGLNAHYRREELGRLFAELRAAVSADS